MLPNVGGVKTHDNVREWGAVGLKRWRTLSNVTVGPTSSSTSAGRAGGPLAGPGAACDDQWWSSGLRPAGGWVAGLDTPPPD